MLKTTPLLMSSEMTELMFYANPQSGSAASYDALARDVAVATSGDWDAKVDDFYRLFVRLLTAIHTGQSIALDGAMTSPNGLPEAIAKPTSPSLQDDREEGVGPTALQPDGRLSVDRPSPAEGTGVERWPASAPPIGERVLPSSRFKRESGGAEPANAAQLRDADWITHASAETRLQRLRQSTARIGIATSGTTGRPKMIWHRLETLTRSVQIGAHHADDIWGFAYSPTHFAGLQVFLQAFANRNRLVRLFGLDSKVIHQAIDQHQITHLSATPTFVRLLCADGVQHDSVSSLTVGGERLDHELVQAAQRVFPAARLRNVYASTEVGSILQAEGDSFSVPMRYRDLVRVTDGELQVHRSLLAESLQDESDEFFSTGDVVELVSEEPLQFRFLARKSDWINVGGYKVNPHKVETLIANMEEIAEVRVFGRPNSVVGNLVCCEAVCRPGCSMDETVLKNRLSCQLERYEIPQIIQLVDRIATTATGKKQR